MIRIKESWNGVKQGSTFGRWTVLGMPFAPGGRYRVVAQCECGFISVVSCRDLKIGNSTCCIKCGHTKHGSSKDRLYGIWHCMKQRCRNPSDAGYHHYGGRGIKVCEEWIESFEVFREWALANGYERNLEIDRADNNEGYSPENCRWVSKSQNLRNKRSNHIVTAFNETKCVAAWVEDSRCVVIRNTLETRLRRGWCPERALTETVHNKRSAC